MKKEFSFFFILAVLVLITSFNKKVFQSDRVSFFCTYKLEYQPDTLNNEKKIEYMLLTISKSFSKFESKYSYLSDSIIASPIFDQLSLNALGKYAVTNFKYKIYKMYKTKTTDYYDIIGQKVYHIKQPYDVIQWKISNESKKIADFTCRKATTSFGGRQWIAWFTSEIPVSDGPYKFMGLPGLIIEISDNRSQYVFTSINIKKQIKNIQIDYPKNTVSTTKFDYNKAKKIYDLQKVTEIASRENSPQVSHQLIQNYQKKQAKKNNSIELK